MQITFIDNFLPFCLLLILFQVKHFIADFLLQNKYMLGKFKPNWQFVLPLSAHCAVNAAFTYLILLIFGLTSLWGIVVFDFVSHFVIDRMKASTKWLGKWGYGDPRFWYVLGLDQMLHHICLIIIVYFIIRNYIV